MKILLVDDDTVSRMARVDLMSRCEGLELVEADWLELQITFVRGVKLSP
jgi:hypothetical protein